MHQRWYDSDTLKIFEMGDCNFASTLSEPKLHLIKDFDEGDTDPPQYRRLIGSLRYLCNTRYDLA